MSIPIKSETRRTNKSQQILKWWLEIEQKSIELSLEYNYLCHADISNFYPSIYTHSIAWVIHGKDVAKKERNNFNLLGNIIDNYIQMMHNGQTNGLPQGSVLMNFIAEIILGYVDLKLNEKLKGGKIDNYQILRYRDDYRIFVNNPVEGEKILKYLTELLLDLGLKLNTEKTTFFNKIINNSLKRDKYEWILKKNEDNDIQKHLLIIHSHGLHFPNAGSLVTALNKFYYRLNRNTNKSIKNPKVLICIIADIAYNNPRTIPVCVAIISRLITQLSADEQNDIIQKIHKRFLQLPNMSLVEIWLQRLSIPLKLNVEYNEPLCKLIEGEKVNNYIGWNNDWIQQDELKKIVNISRTIDNDSLKNLKPILSPVEFDIFKTY